MEIDIFIPSLNLAIEYDGIRFHSNKNNVDRDLRKENILLDKDITLIRIRELKSKCIPFIEYKNTNIFIINYNYNSAYSNLNSVIKLLLDNINNIFNINKNIEPNINRDFIKIQNLIETNKIKNSILETHPHLIKEWHSTKNGNLTPYKVSKGSMKMVWWICCKGHEWQSSINNRCKGSGCPYCGGRKITLETCLATTHPECLKAWNYKRNNELGYTPYNTSFGMTKKVWWICSKGHEWDDTPNSRFSNKKCNCPYCSNHRITEDNSLAFYYPTHTKDWDYKKNGTLSPYSLAKSSDLEVYWKCSDCGCEYKKKIVNKVRTSQCPECKTNKKEMN